MSGASAEHHYEDEILVAYLDRELPECEREEVDHHLGECWICRTRAADIEQGIHIATRAIEEESSRSDEEIKRALQEFFARRTEFESRRRPPLLARASLPWMPSRPLALAFAGAALILIVIASVRFRGPNEPRPDVIMAQAKASEAAFRRSPRPSHQVLRVEGRISSEPVARDLGTLEIWNDSAADGRYSARWMDASKKLRHAVWKPAATTRYAYDPDVRRAVTCRQPVEVGHLVDGFGDAVDLASIERLFLKWVRSRTWTLVSFTDEWAVFAERGGVHLAIERLREGTRDVWKLSASRVDRDRTFEMVLEVDAETYLPRVQAVRVTAGGRVAELTLTVDRWRFVPSHELRPAVFAPAPSIPLPDWQPAIPPRAPATVARPVVPDRVPLPEWALADLELRVRSALHEALQCVDVSVRREAGAGIVVQPLFSDESRMAALELTLAGIEGRNYVRIAPGGNSVNHGTSHSAMILKHARTLREIASSAHQLIGLPLPQERQLARSFGDHRRALRLEMAHFAAELRDRGQVTDTRSLSLVTGDIADFPAASHFLEAPATDAALLKVESDAASLVDAEDADSMALIIRMLTALEGDLLSLENFMRAGSTQASR